MLDFTESTARDYSQIDSFVIHVCVEGAYTLKYDGGELSVKMGESILVPKAVDHIELVTEGGFKILESFVG